MGLVDFSGEFAAADVMGGEWVAEVTAVAAALRGLGMGALSESIFSGDHSSQASLPVLQVLRKAEICVAFERGEAILGIAFAIN
jgi:hypothetical protein